MSDYADLAEMMRQLSLQAVKVARDFPVELDFTPASIPQLERMLGELSALLRESTPPPSDDEMANMAKLWGAYLGETVRRELGGEWQLERPPGVQSPAAALQVRGATIFPTLKIFRRLTNGDVDNVALFFGKVVEELRKRPL